MLEITGSIVIQCATFAEFSALKKEFLKKKFQILEENKSPRKFFKIEFKGRVFFVLQGGLGKVFAAASCEYALLMFKPGLIIDFGAAGALSKSVAVGQIVVGEKTVEHDVMSAFTEKKPQVLFDQRILKKFRDKNYPCVTIFSGDRDLDSLTHRKALNEKNESHAVATWETSAIARIAEFHKIKSFSFRVVTDVSSIKEYENNLHVLDEAAGKLLEELIEGL